MDTAFYKTYLQSQRAALMTAGVKFYKSGDACETMILACTRLYEYLPLLGDDLIKVPGSLKYWLGVPEALFITAEAIPRVTEGGIARVDFFAYMPSGEVR